MLHFLYACTTLKGSSNICLIYFWALQAFHVIWFQKADHVPDAAKDAHQALFTPPPEWKGWQEKQIEEEIFAAQGIKIRRRPFTGPPQHYVGPFEFRLQNEGNTPRNILEEIIWNKDSEVAQVLHSRNCVRNYTKDLHVSNCVEL